LEFLLLNFEFLFFRVTSLIHPNCSVYLRFFRNHFTNQYAIQVAPRRLLARLGFGTDRPNGSAMGVGF
jgi:hypothetical protein